MDLLLKLLHFACLVEDSLVETLLPIRRVHTAVAAAGCLSVVSRLPLAVSALVAVAAEVQRGVADTRFLPLQ